MAISFLTLRQSHHRNQQRVSIQHSKQVTSKRTTGLCLSLLLVLNACTSSPLRTPDSSTLQQTVSVNSPSQENRDSDQTTSFADWVIVDAAIYTLNPKQPWAEALAITGDQISHVGTRAEINALTGASTQVIRQPGAMVLPGLHDSHVHPVWAGVQMALCDLVDLPSIDAIVAQIKNCAKEQTGAWVLGGGYNPALFEKQGPHKKLLDAIVSDRPIYLDDTDGHGAWVNSRALELANITALTKVPEGGVIEIDPATGEPSGTLREGAVNLVRNIAPTATLQQRLEGLDRAQRLANSLGITSILQAQATPTFLEPMYERARNNQLTLNVLASLHYGGDVFETPTPALVAKRRQYEVGRLKTHSAKIYADGVLEGGTAAMLEPYLGFGHRGSYQVAPDTLKTMVQALDKQDIQAHIHAIGDAAIRSALDAIEYALEQNGQRDNRHHISHVQVVNPIDIKRFGELNATANFQALWAYPDAYITDLNLPELGQKRVDQMYPIASIVKAGGRIVGGSDWSVSSLNPFWAIETAITREDATGAVSGVLNRSEAVDLATMLAAYTINTAYLMKHEKQRGSLEVGKQADITIIDRNLFKIPSQQISETNVLYTFLDGDVVYKNE